jgi:hypothetical protein
VAFEFSEASGGNPSSVLEGGVFESSERSQFSPSVFGGMNFLSYVFELPQFHGTIKPAI